MYALTVHQPFADLLVSGEKDVENRVWPTKHRGLLVIHAGSSLARNPDPSRPRGAVVGHVEVVDVVQGHDSRWAEDGCWHWVVANAVRYDTPILVRGRQRLWPVPPNVELACKQEAAACRAAWEQLMAALSPARPEMTYGEAEALSRQRQVVD